MLSTDIERLQFNWSLFLFLFAAILHLIVLLMIVTYKYSIIVYLIELIYYLKYSNQNYKKLFKIVLIATVIFMLNIFSYEGKIYIDLDFVRISSTGIEKGLERFRLILLLFFFSHNIFYSNKNFLMSNITSKKSNLIIISINYFAYLIEIFNKIGMKRSLFYIIRLYNNHSNINDSNKNRSNCAIRKDYYLYNLNIILSSILFLIFIVFKN